MEEDIVRTLSYYDVFDYPLTFSELKKYLFCPVDVSDEELLEIIDAIPIINQFDGYYYLLGRSKLVSLRNNRSEISNQKLIKAKIIAKLLSAFPTIEYIGVNGRLAMHNATSSDNIELFVIVKRNSILVSKLFVNLILLFTGQKRITAKQKNKDKICVNTFLANGNLALGKYGKNLYLAHEIVQLKTLFDRGSVKQDLLQSNSWIKKYFPNLKYSFSKKKKINENKTNLLVRLKRVIKILMQNKVSKSDVKLGENFFYTSSKRKIIMQIYNARQKVYLNLLKDNYWIDTDEARFYLDEKKIRILN